MRSRLSRGELTPLGQSSREVLFENVTAVGVVVDRGTDGGNVIALTLRQALSGQTAAVTEVGEVLTVIAVSGPRLRDVPAKDCTPDFRPREFGPGQLVA